MDGRCSLMTSRETDDIMCPSLERTAENLAMSSVGAQKITENYFSYQHFLTKLLTVIFCHNRQTFNELTVRGISSYSRGASYLTEK